MTRTSLLSLLAGGLFFSPSPFPGGAQGAGRIRIMNGIRRPVGQNGRSQLYRDFFPFPLFTRS